jgi:hypothetical protein
MGARLLPRTLPELFAYALVVERAAAERYAELERYLRAVPAAHLADELEKIAREEREQYELIALGTSGKSLPQVAGWELDWHFAAERPVTEAGPRSAREAVAMALAYERCTQAFYADVADNSLDDAVRAFAADMATDEQRHVERLEFLLERETPAAADEAQVRF